MNRLRQWFRGGSARLARRDVRAPTESLPVSCRLTPLLVLLGSLTLMVSKNDGSESRGRIAGWLIVQAFAVIGGSWWLTRTAARRERWLKLALPVSVALISAPLLWEPIERLWRQQGQTFEGLILDGFRNMMLGLSVFAYQASVRKLCVAGSLFLTVFASCLSSDPFLLGLVIVYAVVGIWWLMGSYWDSLQGKLADQAQVQLPKRWLFGLAGFVATVLLVLSFASRDVSVALSGFMPSSGGTDWSDPYARAGVNDGEMLVAGRDSARTFGPVESEIFMDSTEQSLYDVFNELYGDPPKKNREQQRAIALPANLLREPEQTMATGKSSGSEFSTNRAPAKHRRKALKDIGGDALFHVKGRVPLHLRLQVFDLFDGEDWLSARPAVASSSPTMKVNGGKPWLPLNQNGAMELFASEESHALKIHKLRTPVIPLPLHATGVHIDRVDQPSFFAYEQDSVLRMTRDKLPGQIVIHLRSQAFDESLLKKEKASYHGGDLRTRTLPTIPDADQWKSLAQAWTQGISAGWPQVREVVRRLREFELERRNDTFNRHAIGVRAEAQVSGKALAAGRMETPAASALPLTTARFRRETINEQDSPRSGERGYVVGSPVSEFLEARRGPDYLFATSAAMLLRSLGFSTRVVSGFYPDPANYDVRQKHTAVFKDDLHFWPEVYLGASTWAVIEPTPGYEVLGPPPGWWDIAWSAIKSAAAWAWSHRVAVGASALLLALLIRFRIRLLDGLATLWWSITANNAERRMILNARRLLDRRCAWVGHARPKHTSTARWLNLFGEPKTDRKISRNALASGSRNSRGSEPDASAFRLMRRDFLRLLEWAEFAPASDAWDTLVAAQSPRELCRFALRTWTLQALQEIGRDETARPNADSRWPKAVNHNNPLALCDTHHAKTTTPTTGA